MPLLVEDGMFLAGFDRDDRGELRIEIVRRDGSRYERKLVLGDRQYRIQHVSGLQDRHVTLTPGDRERVARENDIFRQALDEAAKTGEAFFRSGFVRPVEGGRITSVFGSVRILNGVKRNPHNGIDIALPEGAPVYAMSDGIVQLTGDFFYNGKFVMLNHGHGLVSMYLHLSDIGVTDGERVEKGRKIGEIGMTGRATGPHLHWGVQWGRKRIDPSHILNTGIGVVPERRIVVSVSEQRLYLYDGDTVTASYPVSTAEKGTGSVAGSYRTPLGFHRVVSKIGADVPFGTVFVGRQNTGRIAEIQTEPVRVDGDSILTRILRLEGLEPGLNRGEGIDSYSRYIYIHGTHEEGLIGTPVSLGCIRMRNSDVIELFEAVETGIFLNIVE